MRYISSLVAVVCIASSLRATEPPAGFTSLWNGRDLAGFHYMDTFDPAQARRHDRIRSKRASGEMGGRIGGSLVRRRRLIVNDGKGAYLTTDKEYGDIELLIDYKTVAKADSGIYLRGHAAGPDLGLHRGGRQVGTSAPTRAPAACGTTAPARPGKDPLVLADKPFGEWNQLPDHPGRRARPRVYLNDKLVVDHARLENFWDRNASRCRRHGPIQLQTHGGEIRWRNIFVREIPADEANTHPRASTAPTGFDAVFNGKDLTAGPAPSRTTRSRTAPSSASRRRAAPSTPRRSSPTSSPASSSGCRPAATTAWRSATPARATPPTTACASSRSSTTPHAKYAKLDPRQYNGSAYGMVAGPARLPAAGRRMELRGGDRQGLDDQGRAERHA